MDSLEGKKAPAFSLEGSDGKIKRVGCVVTNKRQDNVLSDSGLKKTPIPRLC